MTDERNETRMDENHWGDPVDAIAAAWRSNLYEVVAPLRNLPILLSGGTDSLTILAAQVALGGSPSAYSFRLKDSTNRDFETARDVAAALDIRFVAVEIERSMKQLRNDVYYLIRMLRRTRKTVIQTAQPVYHLARAIVIDGFDQAIVGTGAVCLDDRKVHQLWHYEGEDAAREYRASKLGDRYDVECGTGNMHRIARIVGVTLEEPYSDEPLRTFALELDYAELNRPKQKGIALRAFPDFDWDRWYARNVPLQTGSGIQPWHDELLATPMNRRGKKRVDAVYRDVLAEIEEVEKAI